MNILRPYGSVGDFFSEVSYGVDPSHVDFWALSSQIKTYTEQIEDNAFIKKIRNAVATSEVLIFLGFAFHRQNLRLIAPEEIQGRRQIFASAFKFSSEDARLLTKELQFMFQEDDRTLRLDSDVNVRGDLTCHGVFRTFQRSINPV